MAFTRVGLGGSRSAYAAFSPKAPQAISGSAPRATRGRYRYRAGNVTRLWWLVLLLIGRG
jgi:hypothetical protein